MNRIYLLAPLAAVIVFAIVYGPQRRNYDARLAAQEEATRRAAEERANRQQEAQAVAQTDAQAALEERTRERLERARQEEAQWAAFAAAELRRTEATAQAARLRSEVARLQLELGAERGAVSALQRQQQILLNEQEVVAVAVHQANQSRGTFLSVTDQLAAPVLPSAGSGRVDAVRSETRRDGKGRLLP